MIGKVLLTFFLVPFWCLISIIFLINELFYIFLSPFQRKKNIPNNNEPLPNKEASILILNWNGLDLLKECLPSVVKAVQINGGNHEVIVIDNGSSDNSISWLRSNYPEIKIVQLDKNYGFIGGYNRGVLSATRDILVFLNNDMRVNENFLSPLLEGFSDPSIFAVSAQIFFEDSSRLREETGKTRATWYRGMIGYRHDIPTSGDYSNRYIPAFWLGGGSAAVDRRKFLELGGFDPLLSPLYSEDVDISYMAWKRGWKVLFCPQSEVIHKHRSSSNRLNKAFRDRVIVRNRLLLLWKNITDPGMIFEHLVFLPLAHLRHSWELSLLDTIKVYWMAFQRLPFAMIQRNKCRAKAKLKDREVFQFSNFTYAFKEKYLPITNRTADRLKIFVACAYFPSPRSGGGTNMYHRIRTLASKHQVTLVSFWDEQADLPYFSDLAKVCHRMIPIKRCPTPRRLKIPIFPPAIDIDFYDPKFQQTIEEELAEEDFDVVHVEYFQIAPLIPPIQRCPKVLTHHEVQSAAVKTRMSYTSNPLKKIHLAFQWARWLNTEITIARQFDRVVVVSPEDAWELKRFAPDLQVEVIAPGVDLEYYHPAEAQQEPNSLIYVGNFRHQPNIDSVIFLVEKILPLVHKQIPEVKLYIVGANPPESIQSLAQAEKVIVTGWVADMRPYIQKANIYVLPILTGVGLRTKLLEAWAMGKPVITTALGAAGLNAIHKENIWLAESPSDFAEGILDLLRDEALRKRLGNNARMYIEQHHSWQTAVDKYVKIFRKKKPSAPSEPVC
ncbi:MAG TPA: glycosyltransferase [Anaerolineaceae bacterium]